MAGTCMKVCSTLDDLAMPRLSCQGASNQDGSEVLTELPPLLLELWREQHPDGHEQTVLNFRGRKPVAAAVSLVFSDSN